MATDLLFNKNSYPKQDMLQKDALSLYQRKTTALF